LVYELHLRLRALLPEWESRMDPDLVTLIRGAERLGPTTYGEALAKRNTLWDTVTNFFEQFELLLTPTLPVPPFAAGVGAPDGIPDTPGALPPFSEALPFTYPWNMTGQPAATVPCGFTGEGLPVGMQIVGRRFADATVLRAATAFEQAHPWADRRPRL
jgi:aspartyl-tRNA(Asn)/glutamyl-tRNA(Gln) amidotransferase subunit A